MADGNVSPDRAAVETWKLDTPIKMPTLRQLYREWRCGRKHEHGPDGFYLPVMISVEGANFHIWEQECQSCGRFTIWSERRA